MNKDEMYTRLMQFFEESKEVLGLIKIDRIVWVNYLESADDYAKLRKVYQWMWRENSLPKYVDEAKKMFAHFTIQAYRRALILSPGCTEVALVRDILRDMKTRWQNRPKIRHR